MLSENTPESIPTGFSEAELLDLEKQADKWFHEAGYFDPQVVAVYDELRKNPGSFHSIAEKLNLTDEEVHDCIANLFWYDVIGISFKPLHQQAELLLDTFGDPDVDDQA